MLSSSESDDDDNEKQHSNVLFWDNWNPPGVLIGEVKTSVTALANMPISNIGCWLPPVNFGQRVKKFKPQFMENKASRARLGDVNATSTELNKNWGPFLPYYTSLAEIQESEDYCSLFHPSVFGLFKLWKNEYGNICSFAEAEFENGINGEKGVLIVNKEHLLRKLLGVSNVEWSALSEAVKDTKSKLHFDALRLRNENSLPVLEKLWVYLCQRRHYLPCVSIKIQRSGAKKLTQYLKILPKFVVEEIRRYDGSEIM